ncbi:hypothetical protein ACODT3_30750 [Streptomyces sp. 4.24]|uniref:hypothetical protein n=1 Tax=Streptomyces tritrimontium TaxID=3406573 RepID=UPI003BB71920
MTRTTPPRPLDVAAVFPELADLARTATRLHPSPGSPTVHDSSVGGPLLWPAGEPWPTCSEEHFAHRLNTPEEIRTLRRLLAATAAGDRGLSAAEDAEWDRIRAGHDPGLLPSGPHHLIPVAQLYARDVPDLACPEGADLLQVLWCPFVDIEDPEDGSECVQLRWRRAADAADLLSPVPEPAYIGEQELVPAPCVLSPERVREYPAAHDMDGALAARIARWEEDRPVAYRGDLSVAPGWKAGGWAAPFTFRDSGGPEELRCGVCGADTAPLLTAGYSEWEGEQGSWRPVEAGAEEAASFPDPATPTLVTVGRGYTLQFYACSADPRHRPVTILQ